MIGKIVKVSGPLIVAENLADVEMYDVVKVSDKKLIGEVIELRDDKASIQVYEETSGLTVGDPVESTGAPLSVELGPGLIESIFDGIQRPLNILVKASGNRIGRGIEVHSLDRERLWHFVPAVKKGDRLTAGDVIGTVQETSVVLHKILVPYGVEGEVEWIAQDGEYTICDTVAKVGGKDLSMMQKWPVRKGRPYKSKMAPYFPMITGQRVIDTLFPIAKGGVAAVPGPFGSGKTVVQHQLAKWADADIIVYVGCGERGNEMTDVLQEFPNLHDPKTGEVSSGYRESGYLPEAVINFLALLGWNPGTDQEIMSLDELVELFDITKCSKAGAKFDYVKGLWFNREYILMKDNKELAPTFDKILRENGIEAPMERVEAVVGMMKMKKINFIKELWPLCDFFFIAPEAYDREDKFVRKNWTETAAVDMAELAALLEGLDDFSVEGQKAAVDRWAEETGKKPWNPWRVALVGTGKGPDMYELSAFLGKEETLRRMRKAVEILK